MSMIEDIRHLGWQNIVDHSVEISCKRYRNLGWYENMRFISPFRYPGGKSRQLPEIIRDLLNLNGISKSYLDPFVGGGCVALEAAYKNPMARIHLNDKDPRIAAFWKVVASAP